MEKMPASMAKIIHLLVIDQQGKQWHTAGKGADVGSTFTPLLVSKKKSYDDLLESGFIMDTEVEEGKGSPLSLVHQDTMSSCHWWPLPGQNVVTIILAIVRRMTQ